MKRLGWVLLLLALPLASWASGSVAITNVTVVDTAAKDARRALRRNQTIVVSGGRITAVGRNVRVPEDARIVDGRGKYLIPGLWDMHVHSMYEGRPEFFFPLLIANGVTGVREMASTFPLDRINEIRAKIAAGTILGPRVAAVTGKIVEGVSRSAQPLPEFDYVATPDDARRLVRSRKEQGADFIKVYNWLPRDVYFAIAGEAKKLGLPFAGHIPVSVTAAETADAGQKSLEHMSGVLLSTSPQEAELLEQIRNATSRAQFAYLEASVKAAGTFDAKKAAALFARFRKNGTWQCPTYVLRRARAYISDPAIREDPRLRYVPLSVRERWSKGPMIGEELSFRTVYLKDLELAPAMQRAGLGILAGTDTGFGNFYTIPGFSLHDELRILVQGGLTPLQALQAATINPAKFLGIRTQHGSVERGKTADLVLLDGNPLEDIAHTQKIAAVIANGRYLGKDDLQKILDDVEAAARTK